MHLPNMSSERKVGAHYFKALGTCDLTDRHFLSLVVPLHWKLTICFNNFLFLRRTLFLFSFTLLIFVPTGYINSTAYTFCLCSVLTCLLRLVLYLNLFVHSAHGWSCFKWFALMCLSRSSFSLYPDFHSLHRWGEILQLTFSGSNRLSSPCTSLRFWNIFPSLC